MIKLFKYVVNKKVSSPVYLIHFVTNLCNAKCPHCFVVKKEYSYSAKDELTIEEIEKISKTFSSDLYNVNLTGGEPFIRDDIPQIVDLYAKNAGARSFLIATNGFFAEKIKNNLNTIFANNKSITVVVSLSLDNIGDKYDKLRGVDGLYKTATGLYRDLVAMDNKRLSVQINLTLQRDNYKDIESILNYLMHKEKIKNINLSLTRGETSEEGVGEVSPQAYLKGNKLLDNNLRRGRINGFNDNYLSILNAKNQISRRVIGRILNRRKFISACFAGSLTGALFPNGDVYPCELLKDKIGNVREFKYDFTSLWTSSGARDVRNKIKKSKCFCTHECNWTTNILFNPKYFPELVLRSANIQLGKFGRRIFNG